MSFTDAEKLEFDDYGQTWLPRFHNFYSFNGLNFARFGSSSRVITEDGVTLISSLDEDSTPPDGEQCRMAMLFRQNFCWHPGSQIQCYRITPSDFAALASAWWDGAEISDSAALYAALAAGLPVSRTDRRIFTRFGTNNRVDQAPLRAYILNPSGSGLTGYIPNPYL